MGLSFELPVNLAKIGTGYLTENPIAGFLVSLLAFFVLAAVLVVPIAALLGVEIFPGLVPHSRYKRLAGLQSFLVFDVGVLDLFLEVSSEEKQL